MRYASVCSGIEAPSVAVEPLGWRPVFFSEIEPFPCRLLAHHYPNVPNLGDMCTIKGADYYGTIDALFGGTPCQSFSAAGHRNGLADPRGNLALGYVRLVDQIRPRWIIWENVQGVFSTTKGRDFGAFLRALGEIGYHCAWRLVDSQFFGVAQRRKRVYLVGCPGDWRRPATVLFEPETGQSPYPPTQRPHQTTAERGFEPGDILPIESISHGGMKKQVTGIAPVANGPSYCLTVAMVHGFARNSDPPEVRQYSPLEYERLQGFPDRYTDIPTASDRLRRRALANSMTVPVLRWLAQRIERVDQLNLEGLNLP